MTSESTHNKFNKIRTIPILYGVTQRYVWAESIHY